MIVETLSHLRGWIPTKQYSVFLQISQSQSIKVIWKMFKGLQTLNVALRSLIGLFKSRTVPQRLKGSFLVIVRKQEGAMSSLPSGCC